MGVVLPGTQPDAGTTVAFPFLAASVPHRHTGILGGPEKIASKHTGGTKVPGLVNNSWRLHRHLREHGKAN